MSLICFSLPSLSLLSLSPLSLSLISLSLECPEAQKIRPRFSSRPDIGNEVRRPAKMKRTNSVEILKLQGDLMWQFGAIWALFEGLGFFFNDI